MDRHDPYKAQSDDPLGDLTRLVGQPDPFVAQNSLHQPQADFGAELEIDPIDEADEDAYLSELENELALSMADEDAVAEDPDLDLDIDPAYIEDDLAALDDAPGAAAPAGAGFASAAGYAAAKPRSGRALPIAASLLVAAGVGVAGFYGYGALNTVENGEAPVILAEAAPVKRTVEGPTGREIPHQNKLVYDRVTGEEPEVEIATLLPQPEEVRALPESNGRIEPRKVRTVTVRPDGTIIRDGAIPITQPVSAPAEQPITSQQVARAVPVRVITAPTGEAREVSQAEENALANFSSNTAPTLTDPIAAIAQPVETEPAIEVATETPAPVVLAALPIAKPAGLSAPAPVEPAPVVQQVAAVAAAPVEAAPAAATGWMVQLTSQRSEAQAQSAFDGLKGRFSSVLGSAQPSIARADLGDRGVFYRVRVAASSRSAANELCGSLKAQGGDCFVQYVN
ncbi:MAG: SPOR domain-containing protein [Pseudomonadota bacterium]